MNEYQGCDNCKYVYKSKSELPCMECTHNAIDQWKPMTNADKIRNMDVVELAKFLVKVNSTIQDCMVLDCKCEDDDKECGDCFLEWLQAEVKGEE